MSRFIRIQNRIVNLDAIAWIDFLESGRAMVFIRGLTQEKQNIPLDPDDARRLRAFLEQECMHEALSPAGQSPRSSPTVFNAS
jgi:hypothetical protein